MNTQARPTRQAPDILHLAQAAEFHNRGAAFTAPRMLSRPTQASNAMPNFREQAAAARRAVFEERRRAAVEARIKQQEERSTKRKKPSSSSNMFAPLPVSAMQDSLLRSPHLVSSPSDMLSFQPHNHLGNAFFLPHHHHHNDLLHDPQHNHLAKKLKKLTKTEDVDRQKREMKKEARVREYEIALAMRWAAETKRREEAAQRRAQVDALRRRVEQEREEKRQLAKIKKRTKLSNEASSPHTYDMFHAL
ncbi:hypothetical protein SDRG_15927 [Saprolegnia diclina VS20]|uniref:Uncharacterized protein n=1 Tax=Saprolegnia diclina (strain VS20) TaxID=1156394 RepID=T0PLG8_SAPDV|nr:hypothetical protein SDRG_15927 [Saprolegnia diclina VS20]EQC26234.1 hypothetical protein SDRG_15927 [Saprolegnia diclina VS20]|eukprot:XP_008620335.1 hypothetical protein SDRG_15927 [Saprolegnia diclina VS20]